MRRRWMIRERSDCTGWRSAARRGTGKLKIAGGIEGTMKESIQRAFAYLQGHKVQMGIGQQVDTIDFHVEAIDLMQAITCPARRGSPWSWRSTRPSSGTRSWRVCMVLGDLSIQGNIKVRSLAGRAAPGSAMDNGARRALVPLENIAGTSWRFPVTSSSASIRCSFSDPMTAAHLHPQALQSRGPAQESGPACFV